MMDRDTRDRFLYAIEEAIECEQEANVAAKKARFLQERMRELYKELNKPAKEEETK